MTEPTVVTPAQERMATDVLGWGEPRPLVPDGLAEELRARLEAGLAAIGPPLGHLAERRRGGRVVVTRSLLQRHVCQGWQVAPEPYVHTPANVRGVLGRAAVLVDLADGQRGDPAELVARQWRRTASDRPGDPRSLAAWLNRTDAAARTELQAEVADLVAVVREVWPLLPSDLVQLEVDTPRRITLGGGRVQLVSTLDLTVTSRVVDTRARGLLVDLRTGQPRAPLDRLALRFAALVSTLSGGVPPFRWSTFYVTEGRFVSEDLSGDALHRTVEQIVAAVAELVELEDVAADAPASELRLAAGPWCSSCRRRTDCPVAGTAGRGPMAD